MGTLTQNNSLVTLVHLTILKKGYHIHNLRIRKKEKIRESHLCLRSFVRDTFSISIVTFTLILVAVAEVVVVVEEKYTILCRSLQNLSRRAENRQELVRNEQNKTIRYSI